jgi:hypothetical protein
MEQIMGSPRIEGINEQFERAKLFLMEAKQSADKVDRFRRLIASIYFARAIVELMQEAADKQEVKKGRNELEEMLVTILPRYTLIEKLRIHDFHRFGLLERPNTTIMQGPIKLRTGANDNAAAAITITPRGIEKITTGGSKIIEQRPITINGNQVLDDEKNQYVPIEQVLSEYLKAAPDAIEEFLKLRQSEQ